MFPRNYYPSPRGRSSRPYTTRNPITFNPYANRSPYPTRTRFIRSYNPRPPARVQQVTRPTITYVPLPQRKPRPQRTKVIRQVNPQMQQPLNAISTSNINNKVQTTGLAKALQNLGPDAKDYIECVSNPFGTDLEHHDHPDRFAETRKPQPGSPPSIMYNIKGNCSIAVSANNSMMVGMSAFNKTDGHHIWEVHGPTLSASPSYYMHLSTDETLADLFTTCAQYRIVSCALRVNSVDAPSATSGILRGGSKDTTLATDFNATFATWANLTNNLEPQTYSGPQGCTARFSPVGYSEDNNKVLSDYTNFAASFSSPDIQYALPRIHIVNTSLSSARYLVEWIIHVEVIPLSYQSCPITSTAIQYFGDWDAVLAILSNADLLPLVTDGHSFQSFLKAVGDWFKGAVSWVSKPDNLMKVGKVASTILPFVL